MSYHLRLKEGKYWVLEESKRVLITDKKLKSYGTKQPRRKFIKYFGLGAKPSEAEKQKAINHYEKTGES